jgi:hypothetical protein
MSLAPGEPPARVGGRAWPLASARCADEALRTFARPAGASVSAERTNDPRTGHGHDGHVYFAIIGPLVCVETIAAGSGIRELRRLRKLYGPGRWRKRKGYARIRLADGETALAELHWYEATGIGKREFKIKRIL